MVVGPNSTLVSQALVARIRNNEFIELAELLEDSQSYPDKSNNGRSKKRKIASILQWVECFNAYITILDQPERVPTLLSYSSLIVHAAKKFRGDGWIQYDRSAMCGREQLQALYKNGGRWTYHCGH